MFPDNKATIRIQWFAKVQVAFSELPKAFDARRGSPIVYDCRDGQQIDPKGGEAICQALDKAESELIQNPFHSRNDR